MRLPLLAVVMLLAGCDRGPRAGGRTPSGCTPGRSVSCFCAVSVEGTQVCREDRTFAPCQCDGPLPDAGGTTDVDGGGEDAGLDPDAAARDANPEDAGTESDAGFPDSGHDEDAGFFDTGAPDTGLPDTGTPDAGFPDVGSPDAGFPDAGFPDAGFPDTGVITDAGTPACTLDVQCASGRCHPLYNQCVPVGKKLHCESCTTDTECGLPTDHCLNVTIGGVSAETICAQGCAFDFDCPRGYECSLSNHCYPVQGTLRAHTCASLRDMLARKPCDPLLNTDQCGLSHIEDGTCIPVLGCTIGCFDNADCPDDSSCNTWLVADYCEAL